MDTVKKSKSAPADLNEQPEGPQMKNDEAEQEIDASQGFVFIAAQQSDTQASQYNFQGQIEERHSASLEEETSVNPHSQRSSPEDSGPETLTPVDSGLDSLEFTLNESSQNSQGTSSSDEEYLALPGFSGLYYFTRLALRTMTNPDHKDD